MFIIPTLGLISKTTRKNVSNWIDKIFGIKNTYKVYVHMIISHLKSYRLHRANQYLQTL
jgi:hypothetical protein